MLTDAQWAVLDPLVEACRPKGKTPPRHLRRTIGAIVWRHRNGATWRAIPAEFGPWWTAAQLFIRWAKQGVWRRLLDAAQARRGAELGMAFLDGTTVRAHQKAAGAAKRGARTPTRGTGARRSAAPAGATARRPAWSRTGAAAPWPSLAPGQAHELPQARGLLARLPGVPKWVVADRGYTGHAFREHVWDLGARPAIPPQRYEAPVACAAWVYNNRNVVERLWARLKEWRAVATRYEKTAASFEGVLCLAAAADWIKS